MNKKQLLENKYGKVVYRIADDVYNLAKKEGATPEQIKEILPSGNILINVTCCIIDILKHYCPVKVDKLFSVIAEIKSFPSSFKSQRT